MTSNDLPHLIWSICKSCDSRNEITISASYLFSIGKISWTGNVSCIDSVSDYNVKSVLCRRCSEAP